MQCWAVLKLGHTVTRVKLSKEECFIPLARENCNGNQTLYDVRMIARLTLKFYEPEFLSFAATASSSHID